ncbi:urease accessory protein UreH domain-containing protein [Clostridium sp. ZS2-4]|uniref:urease accessory protein UreH domain-containing protein n=1 Tax=Clostridium sp. ZS2-4 TaxID=2987703 RepID=UPI00227BF46B|nr:sulfite exporter TauE/SafE family protein [Clostridium sp. ZS2-4]MCY6353804.1 sulfite exporter TauE/SafE family protein [Clostridium sp. ZS2-4]
MNIKKEKIKVYNMTCTSCEKLVEKSIQKLDGISNAIASYSEQYVIVEFDTELCNTKLIENAIKNAGYSIKDSNNDKLIGIFIIAIAIILLGNSTEGFDMNEKLSNATYFVLFIVGILTSLHCVGMCGGIMLSQSMSEESSNKLSAIKPAILYNAGRVFSYTILGGIVGALGSVISLSLNFKAGIQILAGLFMVIMGLNMIGFSLFRKFNIKLPWSFCSIKKKPSSPFIVGVLNGFMPCGPLQTMQLYALATGSALKGAVSMFLFSLGTVPLMLTFGAISGLLSKGYTKKMLKFSGILVVVLGLIMGNRGLALAGIRLPSLNNNIFLSRNSASSQANVTKAVIENGVQVINMNADYKGYTPNAFYIQSNIPVKWIIDGKQLTSCNNEIVIPSLNIEKRLESGENIIEFTSEQSEDINFSCWMGMIRGVIKVVDNIDSVDISKSDTSLPPASTDGSCCSSPIEDTTPSKPSIYGDDLDKLPTNKLINKANIQNGTQTLTIKGIGYEFSPLIMVSGKNMPTKLTLDLKDFDNPEAKYEILSIDSEDTLTTFYGKKDIIEIQTIFEKSGGYAIISQNTVLGIIEVTDDFKTADLEKIREKYFK